jgi:hypothetical protein
MLSPCGAGDEFAVTLGASGRFCDQAAACERSNAVKMRNDLKVTGVFDLFEIYC